jgi:serine/threonine-protein kinase
MDAVVWKALSTDLDRALDLEEPARAEWLSSLRQRDPERAAQIEALLEEHRHVIASGFLESSPPAPATAAISAGCLVGAYTLHSPIGQGGMGSVWLAVRSDGRFERRAAIKFLQMSLAGRGEDRFRREGRLLARLSHSNIAQLVDAGVTDAGVPYLVLELVDGEPIDQYCARLRLDSACRVVLVLDMLAAVEHAHANLIVHRDIKPSNVLVDAAGRVKLLDFGIAKLLDDHDGSAPAMTGEGTALTPAYAAPEQLTGGAISTATDIYAAGVLLYELVTGAHPAGDARDAPASLMQAILEREPTMFPRGDLGTILRKALKKNPGDRYGSVAAFADDLRRCLARQPISARPDTLRYRAMRFVQRNPWPVAATAVILVGLTSALYAVDRQRTIAEHRFLQVRQLATKLLEVDVRVQQLPGGARTRQFLVDTALEYLRGVTADVDVREDPDLALELGTAYMRVARVQGVPITPNLGQADEAEKNLQAAEALVLGMLEVRPDDRAAAIRAAQIAHDRMTLAQARRPDTAALPLAQQSERWLQQYLSTGPVLQADAEAVVITGMNVANWYVRKDLVDEGLRLLDRVFDVAMSTKLIGQAGASQIVRARALRGIGDLEGALVAIQRGVALLEPTDPEPRVGRLRSYALALTTQGEVLGQHEAVSLERHQEAERFFERALAIRARMAAADPAEAGSRFGGSTDARLLAGVLLTRDPERALRVFEQALGYSREIANNPRARRDEARALSGAARALTRLGRLPRAREYLDAAFPILAGLELYPAAQILPQSEPFDALRARAELEAATGDLPAAMQTVRDLIAAVAASEAAPATNLLDAYDVALLYQDLAALQRRAGDPIHAEATDARRLDLWNGWMARLPGNAFVERQLAAAR